jgi:carbamoyltransferase
MIILGVNETTHDASVSLIEDNIILFAGHAERYSKIKNDWFVNDKLISDALKYGKPDLIAYYEKPLLKKSRILISGGLGGEPPRFMNHPDLKGVPVKNFSHHYSHAAAGYYTSRFEDAVIVVLDAIGEWNTSSIWVGVGDKIQSVYKKNYPFSFGLFYSAFTQLLGLKPNEEEYILMGMASYGKPGKYYSQVNEYFSSISSQKYNFHKGIIDWQGEITPLNKYDIASAVQKVYEDRLYEFMEFAKKKTGKQNLVFMGGCALNATANTRLWEQFSDVWVMPNPGDAGSSLGAAAAAYGKHLNWTTPYLGYDIGQARYPAEAALNAILEDGIAPVVYGRAEYGPRALGNRSIFGDPRDPEIKSKVNKIKKREQFRPFAPVVLEEYASDWFEMPATSPYMQYTVKCKKPNLIPSVVHIDGTSRVQTVNRRQHPGLHKLLTLFYKETGIPVLLNTSLNIKGQPLLNDEHDILEWEKAYGQKVIK